MPQLYRLKISLLEPHRPISELHRIVEMTGNMALNDLQKIIVQSFGGVWDYAWQFIIAKQRTDNLGKLTTCKELVSDTNFPNQLDNAILHSPNISFDELALELKDYIYLWLLLNDNHQENNDIIFRLRIEKIATANNNTPNVNLIKKVGDLPNALQHKMDLNFEMSLISALMLIATGGDGEPVRWQELIDNGVADELTKRNLIKPCVNPMHIVRMTAYGESELARFLEMTGVLDKE